MLPARWALPPGTCNCCHSHVLLCSLQTGVQSYGKTPNPMARCRKPTERSGSCCCCLCMQHLSKFQGRHYPGLPLTGRSERVCSKVQEALRSSPQERRIPKNSRFFCFLLNTRHWVTLPYLLPRANNSLVQCDRERQGLGLDSRDP